MTSTTPDIKKPVSSRVLIATGVAVAIALPAILGAAAAAGASRVAAVTLDEINAQRTELGLAKVASLPWQTATGGSIFEARLAEFKTDPEAYRAKYLESDAAETLHPDRQRAAADGPNG